MAACGGGDLCIVCVDHELWQRRATRHSGQRRGIGSLDNTVLELSQSADHVDTSEDALDQCTTDLSMSGDANNVVQTNSITGHSARRRVRGLSVVGERTGRTVTRNDRLANLRKRGTPLDIHFAQDFGKVCGRHAAVFKSEITVRVRQEAPLRVKKWRDIEDKFPGTMESIWRLLKEKFPEISRQDHECVMAQVERQYNVCRYNLYKIYRTTNICPSHVDPDDWKWLIANCWNDEQFQKRSKQNSVNRSKQDMKSHVGTKSIVQIAYELRDPVTGAWPSAMEVWNALYFKTDGTWSIPNGEEILKKLEDASEKDQEKIAAAQVPLVEHFALVLGRKPNHSRGVGVLAINQGAQERHRLHAQAQAAKQWADDAQQHAL